MSLRKAQSVTVAGGGIHSNCIGQVMKQNASLFTLCYTVHSIVLYVWIDVEYYKGNGSDIDLSWWKKTKNKTWQHES